MSRSPVIAYTVGSFWYCPEHGRPKEDASATRLNQLSADYTYNCDECGVAIPVPRDPRDDIMRLAGKMDDEQARRMREAIDNLVTATQRSESDWQRAAENWASEAERLKRENSQLNQSYSQALNLLYAERTQILSWAIAAGHGPHRLAVWNLFMLPAEDVKEEGWYILYLHTSEGQMSWHISPEDEKHLWWVSRPKKHENPWDGHTTEEKYQRITRLVETMLGRKKPCIFHGKEYLEGHDFTYGDQCRRCGYTRTN